MGRFELGVVACSCVLMLLVVVATATNMPLLPQGSVAPDVVTMAPRDDAVEIDLDGDLKSQLRSLLTRGLAQYRDDEDGLRALLEEVAKTRVTRQFPGNVFFDAKTARDHNGGKRTAPLVLGHRAAFAWPNQGQENTLKAVNSALTLGIDGVEIDVRASKDGVFFLFHDVDCQRTLGKPGNFADYTADQIKASPYLQSMDLGNGTVVDYGSTQPVALFEDFLKLIKGKRSKFGHLMAVDLDLKSPLLLGDRDVGKQMGELVKKHGVENQVIGSTFYLKLVRGVEDATPKIPTAFGYDDNFPVVGMLWKNNNHFQQARFRTRTPPIVSTVIDKVKQGAQWVKNKAQSAANTVKNKVIELADDAADLYHHIVNGSEKALGKLVFKTLNQAVKFYLQNTDAVIVEFTVLTDGFIKSFKDHGYIIGSYTFFPVDTRFRSKVFPNLDEEVRLVARLAELGVDWLECDNPVACKTVVNMWAESGKVPTWAEVAAHMPPSH